MRKIKGTIVSDKMQKTRIVAVERLKMHPKYKKYTKVTKRYKAHDETNEYKAGDVVIIEETKPMSKDKRWKIVERVERATSG